MKISTFVVWFTGLSGSGKTTLATLLKQKLEERNLKVILLDGDEIRNLLVDNDHSEQGTINSCRQIAKIAQLIEANDIITIVCKMSPYREIREAARQEVGKFREIYVECSLEECVRRDPKGVYRKALAGELTEVTGMGTERVHQYDVPEQPFITLNTEKHSAEDLVMKLLDKFVEVGDI